MLIEKKVEENGDGPSGEHVRIVYKKNLFILFGDPLRINSQMHYLLDALDALDVYTSKYYNVYRSYL